MKILNNSGPNIKPYGTKAIMFFQVIKLLFIGTFFK